MSATLVNIREGEAWYALAFLRKEDDTQALIEDIMSITLYVYDAATNTLVSEESYAVADTVSDTVLNDGSWDVDGIGYTFKGRVRADLFTRGSGRYEAELIARLWNSTGSSDPDIIANVYEVTVNPLRSS